MTLDVGGILLAAMTLWEFHCVYDDVQPADAIVGLGSYDVRVADHCARLFDQGLSGTLLFTGSSGNWTSGLYGGSEAEAFAKRAVSAGVPRDAIILEERATNIGENIAFSSVLIPLARTVILVAKPQTQLRCSSASRKQWPKAKIMTTAPFTSFEDQPTAEHSQYDLICEMVGDVERLKIYPSLGFQEQVAIPESVIEATNRLIEAGFTDHLPS